MVIYFSGTGNSRYAAKLIAHRLQDEIVDAAEFIKSGTHGEFTSQKPWVFVSPTHGWRIPRIFEEFIKSSAFFDSRQAYFVMTCGTEVGNAAVKLAPLCRYKGFEFMGLLEVRMPENYVAMFAVPGTVEAAEILAKAVPVIETAPPLIAAGKPLPPLRPGMVDKLKTTVVNPVFYAVCVRSGPFKATDACIGCGKCVRLCPTNAIRMELGKPAWGRGCTHCMACICSCPLEAIEYGRASLGKPRYLCPEYTAED